MFDGANTTQQSFNIAVGDINEAPHTVLLSNNSINEDAALNAVVGTVSATDPENNTLSYSFSDNANGMFTINSVTGVITLAGALDFETTEDYSVTVDVFDGANTTQQSFNIAVDDVNETTGTTTVLEAHFDGGTDGFVYVDGTFGGSVTQSYASGLWNPDGLQVMLGGLNNDDIIDMSGGWQTNFNVSEATEGTLTFRYNMTQAQDYESNEYSEIYFSLNGVATQVTRITGNGNGGGEQSTGWQTYEVSIGQLDAGVHTLAIGGYNNQKTHQNESTEILIDDVILTTIGSGASANAALQIIDNDDIIDLSTLNRNADEQMVQTFAFSDGITGFDILEEDLVFTSSTPSEDDSGESSFGDALISLANSHDVGLIGLDSSDLDVNDFLYL